MATAAPIGWSSYAQVFHYKTVLPCKSEVGMYNNLYENITKKFLPKDVYDNSQRKKAKDVLKRQKKIHQTQRPKRQIRIQRVYQASNDPTYENKTENVFHERPFFPPIKKNLPITSYLQYSPEEVNVIVKRLSTYEKCRVPESRGYAIPSPELQWSKDGKKLNESDIQNVVNRLSQFDPKFHPPESRGSARPMLMSRGTNAAMSRGTTAASRPLQSRGKSSVSVSKSVTDVKESMENAL